MVPFAEDDNDLELSVAEHAVQIMTSGVINFDILDSNGSATLAGRVIEISGSSTYSGNLAPPDFVHRGDTRGFVSPTEFPNTIFIQDRLTFGTGTNDRIVTIVHEASHLSDAVEEEATRLSLIDVETHKALGTPSFILKRIMHEVVVQDVVELVGGYSHFVDADLAIADSPNIQHIIDQEGAALTQAQKDAILATVEANFDGIPVTVDGLLIVRDANGDVVGIDPNTGLPPQENGPQIAEPTFLDTLIAASQEVIDAVVQFVSSVADAIVQGAQAVVDFVSSAVQSVVDWVDGLVASFTRSNSSDDDSLVGGNACSMQQKLCWAWRV